MKITIEIDTKSDTISDLKKIFIDLRNLTPVEEKQEVIKDKKVELESTGLPTNLINSLRKGRISFVGQLIDLYNHKPVVINVRSVYNSRDYSWSYVDKEINDIDELHLINNVGKNSIAKIKKELNKYI